MRVIVCSQIGVFVGDTVLSNSFMPRFFHSGTPLAFDLEIEQTARKLKKEATRKKISAGLFGSSSYLTPETSTPEGTPLWNESIFFFQKYPYLLFKTAPIKHIPHPPPLNLNPQILQNLYLKNRP